MRRTGSRHGLHRRQRAEVRGRSTATARAGVFVGPTYVGTTGDLTAVAETVHEYGVRVVDAAW